ncbi:unnamed protein product [Mytilus coruscus]|uniref:Endonuclease/exonuclease/phosphatase domain-containing protein n=1 Tax=Mytilus coruscus TaxID=42192 RepID=A0A6J8C8C2_MYTCO|nr:unnamed protein product [Mytilus coruscus]
MMTGSEPQYREHLDKISSIIDKYDETHSIIITGDLNGSLISTRNNNHDKLLKEFCRKHHLNRTFENTQGSTFYHHNGKSCSQIDYILENKDTDILRSTAIEDQNHTNGSAHVPIRAKTNMSIASDKIKGKKSKPKTILKWEETNIGSYQEAIETLQLFVRLRVMKFLRVLTNLVGKISNHKQVYEGSLIKLLANFAEMCCLHPEISISKEDEAVWKNLHGINNIVSKPDICLYKHGITTKPEVRTSDMVVSVKVKKDSNKVPEELEIQLRLMESTHLSNSCSSLSSNESDDGSIPSIEIDLNKEVLGQHTGELLLALYECHRRVDAPILTLPGMIVDGTKKRKLKNNPDKTVITEDLTQYRQYLMKKAK